MVEQQGQSRRGLPLAKTKPLRSRLGECSSVSRFCVWRSIGSGELHYGQNTGNLESRGKPVFLPYKSHHHPCVRVLTILPSTTLPTMEFDHKCTSCNAKRFCSPIPIKWPGWSNQSQVLLALGQQAQSHHGQGKSS